MLALVTLIGAVLLGAYIVLARRVHARSHGWACAALHAGAAGLCAAAAVDAPHGNPGTWPLVLLAIAAWLFDGRRTWRGARRRPQCAEGAHVARIEPARQSGHPKGP